MDFHDPFAAASHLAFAAFLLFAGLVLVRLTRRHARFRRWAVGLYAASAVLLYTASGLFHGVRHTSDADRELFRRFDLTGIFLLVAGSYLPVFAYLLHGRWRVWMTAAVAALAVGGIAAVWLLAAPTSGTMVPVYAGLAAVGLVPVKQYLRAGGWRPVAWMFAAAGVYALGGVSEVLRWPTVWAGVIGPHEVLHVTDVLGTLVHLRLVVWLVGRAGHTYG
jgi:hemolysin III